MSQYPMLGEPLPIELANTVFAHGGRLRDGLTTAAQLNAWLRTNAKLAPGRARVSSATQLETFRALRDALRQLFDALIDTTPPPREALELVNELSARAPSFPRLEWVGVDPPTARTVETGEPDATMVAAVARAGIELLAGPDRELLHKCHGPGCVLFFIRQHPRREWCSAACGNRARVARHYHRHRSA
jgi:predicted RNA-binding Zn ribbon-like protein